MDRQTYDRMVEQEQAALLRNDLERINGMTRHGLLVLLDKEASKSNTERLRKRARMLLIEGTISNDEVWRAVNVDQPTRHRLAL